VPKFVTQETSEVTNSRARILKLLKPYAWPKDVSIRRIIIGATALLFVSKGLNAYVPFILKEGIDTLASAHPNFSSAFFFFGAFGVGKIISAGA
jgi:hypothetical protein